MSAELWVLACGILLAVQAIVLAGAVACQLLATALEYWAKAE